MPREGCDRPDEIIDHCVIPNDRVLDYLKQGYKLRVNVVLVPDKKTRVLLVADDTIIMGLCPVLEELNCEVDLAATGADAIKEASENRYDLIFMDIGLSDQDGIEVARKIRILTDTQKAQVPIMVFSTPLDETQKKAFSELDMKDILIKPAQSQLQSVLSKWVPTWMPRREPTGSIS